MVQKSSGFIKFARFLVRNPQIDHFVSFIILLNAVVIAMQTLSAGVVPAAWIPRLYHLDRLFLYFFCFEVGTRIFLMLLIRKHLRTTVKKTLLNGWNLFDIFTVGVAFVPGLGALRTFRLLRLIGMVESFKELVSNMLRAFQHSLTIFWLSLLMVFVFGVTATLLFGAAHPEYFGHLGRSMLTLYYLMFFDDLNQVMLAVHQTHAWGWVFFVVYPVVMGLIILGLLLGVILDTMDAAKAKPATRRDIRVLEKQIEILLERTKGPE